MGGQFQLQPIFIAPERRLFEQRYDAAGKSIGQAHGQTGGLGAAQFGTVEQAAKDIGAKVELVDYVRFQLGEGIEKEESDFAAEVAAAVAG